MSNIEKIFKSSLENSEMPFDPKAWDAMSARLDQAMPANVPKTSFKWIWAACAVIVAGISAFYFTGNDNKLSKVNQQTSVASHSNEKAVNHTEESKTNVAAKMQNANTEKAANPETGNPDKSGKKELQHTEGTAPIVNKDPKTNPVDSRIHSVPPVNSTPISNDPKAFSIVFPKVNDTYCEGEKVAVRNSNSFRIQLAAENGEELTIDPNKSLSTEVSNGDYYFVYVKNGKTEREPAFKVQQKPKADFYADEETLYEKGLPVNNLNSVYPAKTYTWTNAKGEVLSDERQFDAHLFTKGQHEITLKVENANGCSSQVTKQVRCDMNYNLLAVSGFDPASSDSRNNTFIPYALLEKERNIPFKMEIIDPRTGQIIYKTENANAPWDGTDMNTNQLVPANSTYIWKVTIYNRAQGEPKNQYQGTITRI